MKFKILIIIFLILFVFSKPVRAQMGMLGQGWTGGSSEISTGLGFFWFIWLVTIVLADVLLVALIRYFWKKGDK